MEFELTRILSQTDTAPMAALHATSFDPSWPETDMAVHVDNDISIGIGDPLNGFIIIRPVGDQAEILTLVTHPRARGHGTGTKLLRAGEQMAAKRGVTTLFLEVAEDNPAALALYRQSGYRQFGRRPAYYRRKNGRVAALTFRKELDAPPGRG